MSNNLFCNIRFKTAIFKTLMKNTSLLVLALLISVFASAQNKKKRPDSIKRYSSSIMVGANAMIKNTWILNKNLSKFGEDAKRQPAFGSSVGINVLWYPNNRIAIGLNPSYGTMNQSFTGQDTTMPTPNNPSKNVTYESSIHFSCIDIPLYFKYTTEGGAYFEAGFLYGMILSASYKSTSANTQFTVAQKNTSSMWNTAYYAPILGLGFDMHLTDDLILEGSIRAAYGVNNMRGHDGRPTDWTQPNAPSNGPIKLNNGAVYDSKVSSHYFWAGVGVGIIYRFDI